MQSNKIIITIETEKHNVRDMSSIGKAIEMYLDDTQSNLADEIASEVVYMTDGLDKEDRANLYNQVYNLLNNSSLASVVIQ